MIDPSAPPVFTSGRIASWVVLALIAASIIYSVWRVLANWAAITV